MNHYGHRFGHLLGSFDQDLPLHFPLVESALRFLVAPCLAVLRYLPFVCLFFTQSKGCFGFGVKLRSCSLNLELVRSLFCVWGLHSI